MAAADFFFLHKLLSRILLVNKIIFNLNIYKSKANNGEIEREKNVLQNVFSV